MPTLVIIPLNKYFLINEQVSGKDQRNREYQRREGPSQWGVEGKAGGNLDATRVNINAGEDENKWVDGGKASGVGKTERM